MRGPRGGLFGEITGEEQKGSRRSARHFAIPVSAIGNGRSAECDDSVGLAQAWCAFARIARLGISWVSSSTRPAAGPRDTTAPQQLDGEQLIPRSAFARRATHFSQGALFSCGAAATCVTRQQALRGLPLSLRALW